MNRFLAERVYPHTYRVEQITYYIKEYLSEDERLASLAVVGEVSSFKVHSSGHIYLTLQEGECRLKAVLFRRYAALQKWLPQEGEQAIVIGKVSLYERDGSVQLYAQALLPADGGAVGGRQQALEALKRQLEEEGLFSPERKQPLRYSLGGWESLPQNPAPPGQIWTESCISVFPEFRCSFIRRWFKAIARQPLWQPLLPVPIKGM